MKSKPIYELARTIRSKNAGSFMLTLEIIFDDRKRYNKIKELGAISKETIASAYNLPTDKIVNFIYYDAGMGIKASIKRSIPSGGPGDTDVYGCQQYAPLLDITIPWD